MKQKNIVLIMTDQQRKDTITCYGGHDCQTPNLDALTKDSIVFNNAYTTCAVCSPARSSIQAGLYPSKTGMETNIYTAGCMAHELEDTPYLLSRQLNSMGYVCGYTGKWHLGFGKKKDSVVEHAKKNFNMTVAAYKDYGTLPTDIGYIGDNFPGHGNGGYHFEQYKKYLYDNNLKFTIKDKFPEEFRPGDHSCGGEVISPQESTNEHFLVERSKEIIKEMQKEEKPFFLNLNFWGPHAPYYAPTHFLDMYRDRVFC